MAVQEKREQYSHAIIDCSDMTLTELRPDSVRTYSIMEILKRWDGITDIEIEISRRAILPENKG